MRALRFPHPGCTFHWRGALALALLVWLQLHAAAATVTARMERDTLMAGETGTLQIIVEGGTPQSIGTFGNGGGLNITPAGQSSTVEISNGQTISRRILNYAVTGRQPGSYTIPAVRVVVDGQTLATQPVNVTVTKNDLAGQQNQLAFVKLVVPKQEIYVGEIIPIEIQLYLATRGEGLQAPQLKSDGFVIHKQAPHTQSNTQIGGTAYTVVAFKWAVSAAKAGNLSLGPVDVSLTLLLRGRNDGGDPLDFFAPRFQRRPVNLSSSNLVMNVLPLPAANVPPSFTGAVGEFDWSVAANPTELAAGDPITLKIAISGQGNLDGLKLPEFNWPRFKAYQPNANVGSNDPLGLAGVKSFEQVVSPEDANIKEIPAFEFAYFHPPSRAYRILKQPAIPLQVRAGAASTVQPVVVRSSADAPEDEPAPRNDIVHIKAQPGALLAVAPPVVRQPWFLLLQALPIAGLIAASFWRRRQDALSTNPRLRRRLETDRKVRHGLAELRQHAAAQRPAEYFSLLFRLLQEQVGDRLDLPAAGITEADLAGRLEGKAAPELMTQVQKLFQLCNQARYAPESTGQNLQTLLPEIEAALAGLRQLPD